MLEKYLTWFRAHERLLIIALVLFVTAWGFNKYLDHDAMVRHDQAVVAQQTLKQQDAANKQLAAQIAELQKENDDKYVMLVQELNTLQANMDKRDAAAKAKIVDVQKPKTPPQAVADLSSAYQLPVPIVPTDTGAVVATEDLQLFTETKIEADTAKADLQDTQKELVDTKDALQSSQTLVSGLQEQVTGLNEARKEDDAAHKAEVKELKAEARKSKRNWFIAGYVAGAATVTFLKVWKYIP